MDLSKFSDKDLDALESQDLTKMSDYGLHLLELAERDKKSFGERLWEGAKEGAKGILKDFAGKPMDPNSPNPFGSYVNQNYDPNRPVTTGNAPLASVVGFGGGLLKGGAAIAEKVLPYLGASGETAYNATNPAIQTGNEIIDYAKGMHKQGGALGAMAPYAIPGAGVSGLVRGATATGVGAYAMTPESEDPAVQGVLGSGLHLTPKAVSTAAAVPYNFGKGTLNIGRGKIGGENSALHVYTPEQLAAIQGLYDVGEIGAMKNAAAQVSGQTPKPGRMWEGVGESVARDIFSKDPYTLATTLGPATAGAIMAGPLGAAAGAGVSLAKKSIAPILSSQLLKKIEPTTTGAKSGGIEVIVPRQDEIAPAPDNSRVRTADDLQSMAQRIKTEEITGVEPTPLAGQTTATTTKPAVPTTPIDVAVNKYRTAQPDLKMSHIQPMVVDNLAKELMVNSKNTDTPLNKFAAKELANRQFSAWEQEQKVARAQESARLAQERYATAEAERIARESSPEYMAEQQRIAQEAADAAEAKAAEQLTREKERLAKAAEVKALLAKQQTTPIVETTPVVKSTPIKPTPVAKTMTPLETIQLEVNRAKVNEAKNTLDNMMEKDTSFNEQTGLNQEMAGVRKAGSEASRMNNYAKTILGEKFMYFDSVAKLNPNMKMTQVIDTMKVMTPDEIVKYLNDNGLEAPKIGKDLFEIQSAKSSVSEPQWVKDRAAGKTFNGKKEIWTKDETNGLYWHHSKNTYSKGLWEIKNSKGETMGDSIIYKTNEGKGPEVYSYINVPDEAIKPLIEKHEKTGEFYSIDPERKGLDKIINYEEVSFDKIKPKEVSQPKKPEPPKKPKGKKK